MQRQVLSVFLALVFACSCLCACHTSSQSDSTNETSHIETTSSESSIKKTELEIARENVVNKYKNQADFSDTPKYIEDYYKKYSSDSTIANIYYYCIAKDQYRLYYKLFENKYMDNAKEYALKINPEYDGEFSEEMHEFVNRLFPNKNIKESQKNAAEKENKYNQLTNSQKKDICKYIQSQYDYYDKKYGGYTGDKYSDLIMQQAAEKYGLTAEQVYIIWMNMYSY